MSVGMDMDVSGVSRTHVSIRPSAEVKATLKPEAERPRCSSTPCSPIRGTVAGYQILHMDSNYLVGFSTGEELLKLTHKWPERPSEKYPSPAAVSTSVQSTVPRSVDLGVHRSSRIFKAKSRYYQPYDVPAANGRKRRRSMPSSRDTFFRTLTQGKVGKRAQLKCLDYLNLDKLNIKESSDTEVLQHQLQHLNLRGEHGVSKKKS